MKKGKTKTVQARKDMAKIVNQLESNDTDVLTFLASDKSFDQCEKDRLFTFTVGTAEAEHLMIKLYNKERDIMDIYLIKRTFWRKCNL